MKFDEFNKKMHESTEAYRKLARWNEELRAERDEARRLAEEWRDGAVDYSWAAAGAPGAPLTAEAHLLPWEAPKP